MWRFFDEVEMQLYLYRFGFQTPNQLETDFEDSKCVWIEADSEESALEWGREVSEQFIKKNYPGMPSWRESGYAHWIETGDARAIEWAHENPVPRCRYGELPSQWFR